MISPTDSLDNEEKRLNKIAQTLQSKSGGYVGTMEFLHDLYAFYKVDGEIVAREHGFKNFAEFLKSKMMHPYVEIGMNMDGKTVYQPRRDPRTDHIQFCYKEQNPYENIRNRGSDRNTVAASSSKFLYNPPSKAPVVEKPQKQQKINWELPDSFSEEEDVGEPSNGSLRSNNATTASVRMASSDKLDKKEESTKIRYTQRAAGQYTDDEDSDNEADDNTVTAPNKKTSENSDDNIFSGITHMKKFTKPTSNESNHEKSETAPSRTLDPPKTFNAGGAHGEKWLAQLQQQKKHRVTENAEINEQETNVASAPLTSSVAVNKTNRAASVASMMSTKLETKRSRGLTTENLEKLGDVIQAMVEYHSPRAVLLEDLMDAMEKVEPKFLSLEDEMSVSYTAFLRQYCPNVNVFGNAKSLNLLWKENDD